MEITTKIIQDDVGNAETRYFAKTEDNFDGDAQGYGYKSIEKLKKAYWFYKNRNKINNKNNQAKTFLEENPSLKNMLKNYFDIDNYLDAAKNGETLSMLSFINALENENRFEEIKKLNENKSIWKSIIHLLEV